MQKIEDIKLYSLTATSSVLLVMYSVTLFRVLKGSRFTLVIRLIVLLMFYNIGFVAHQWLLKFIFAILSKSIK